MRRFEAGSHHYVFEVCFEDRVAVVVRVNTEQGLSAMVGASRLSSMLRPRGVRLPQVIAEDMTPPFPHMVLERLAGTDFGHVCTTLSKPQLEAIAAQVARAQRIVAATPTAGRYGYAVDPADAPRQRWSEVLEDNAERSQSRIASAGLFELSPVRAIRALVDNARAELDALPAIPFLHDTTTKNVIVAPEGTFSGIVDVDDLCFGDPRYVVALTHASLIAHRGPTHYAEAWMELAGFRDDRVYRLYVALFLVDFMSEHGQIFNGNQRASDPQARQRLLEDFDDALGLTA